MNINKLKMLIAVIATVVLIGCIPQTLSSNNQQKAKPVIEIPYNSSGKIEKLHVLPAAFSRESIKNYPEFIKQQKAQGFGNAIWNELDDLLYDTGYFKLLSANPAMIAGIGDVLEARGTSKRNIELPDKILTVNTNFFIRKVSSMDMMKVHKQEKFHVTVHLKYFELDNNAINIAIPASGDFVDVDLFDATKIALKLATKKLLRRINAKRK